MKIKLEGLFGHNVVEVLPVNFLSVTGGPLEHFLELIRSHGLSEFSSDSSDVLEVDPLRMVVVKEVENSVDSFTGFAVSKFGADSLEELLEVDLVSALLELGNHLVDGRALLLESEGVHGGLELLRVDGAGSVGIKERESLLDLLNLLLSESWSVGLARLGSGSSGHLVFYKLRDLKFKKVAKFC